MFVCESTCAGLERLQNYDIDLFMALYLLSSFCRYFYNIYAKFICHSNAAAEASEAGHVKPSNFETVWAELVRFRIVSSDVMLLA